MLCVGSSIAVLAIGRIFQGLSAAVVGVVGLALLADTAGPEHIGQVMGYVSLASNVAGLIAPLLGGVVYGKGGYYAVFAMCFGLVGVDIVFRFVMIEKKVAAHWLDSPEIVTGTIPPTSVAGGIEDDREGNSSLGSTGFHNQAGIQCLTEATLPLPEKQDSPATRTKSQLPPTITLLASPRMLNALWGIFAQSLFRTAFDSTLPIFCETTFGWTSTGAGLIFLAFVFPTFAAPYVGALADKHGPRWLATAGFVLALPSFVLLRLVTYNSSGQVVLLCALLALIGLSLALILPPMTAEATHVIRAEKREKPAYAQAYGLVNCMWAAGTLVGPIWGGYVVAEAGWATMGWSLALVSGVSVIPTVSEERLRLRASTADIIPRFFSREVQ
ncbi:hypothetical protein MMC17_008318 [Xylographa soralifera]|nr:hypothetical protein [Xylographa soralifera]